MNIKDQTIDVLSDTYFTKFKEHLDNQNMKDALAIMNEYVIKDDREDDNYEWLFLADLHNICQ